MKSKSLLTEAIVSALLFVICALVAVSLLLSGYVSSRKSGEMIEAIEVGRSVVEQIRATPFHADWGEDAAILLDKTGLGDKFDGVVYVYSSYDELSNSPHLNQSGGFSVALVDIDEGVEIDGALHVYNGMGELLLALRCATAWEVTA